MIHIKNIIKKITPGLKSQLAVLAVSAVVLLISTTFTFAGLYVYNKAFRQNFDLAGNPVATKPVTVSSDNKNALKPTKPTTGEVKTPAKKTNPTVKPAVIVEAVKPAPSSSVESLKPVTTTPDPVVEVPADPTANPVRVSTTTYSSSNWSGYLSTGGKFTSVSGSWTIPTVIGEAGVESGDGAWVGIGGVTTSDLIQVGTLQIIHTDGSVMYGAFYEILPAAATLINMPVSPGDVMSAYINETSQSQWIVTINNLTKGTTFTKNLSYASTYSSAEWVEEAPTNGQGNIMPLNNFGTVTFNGCKATVDGYIYNIVDIGASSIRMMFSGSPIAVPSPLYSTGFSVARSQ